MSINIEKRTRAEVTPATDPVTYTDWSEWSSTTDSAPYENTSLVEYRIDKAFETSFLEVFPSLMSAAISTDTPYQKTLDYLQTELDDSNLTPAEKANLKAQVMANITTSITNNAMSLAMQMTEKEIKIGTELDILISQKDYSVAQKIALEEQLVDNRNIKAAELLGSTYGTVGAGGLVVSEDMWKVLFDIVNSLTDIDAPESTSVTKAT